MDPMLDHDPEGQWMHDLRNALNVLGSGVVLSRRLLQKGRGDEALEVLLESEQSLGRCFALLAAAHDGEASSDRVAVASGHAAGLGALAHR